jgi:hypothetical protein
MDQLLERARLYIPLTDEEIHRLYLDATGKKDKAKSTLGLSTLVFALSFVIGVCVWVVAFQSESAFATWWALGAFASALALGRLEIALRGDEPIQQQTIDTYSPEVLGRVSEYLAGESLQKADDLSYTIGASRERIRGSLYSLELVVEQLTNELEATSEPSVRLLIESRVGSARTALSTLRWQDRELIDQQNEVDKAVAPVRELVEKVKRLATLSGTLEEIQAAHGLVESTAEAIEYHAVELALLHSLTAKATATLNDIRKRVDANSLARLEVEREKPLPL